MPAPARQPAWLKPAIIVLTAAVLMGWFAIPIVDSDTWCHLKTGQYTLEKRALDVPDPFSYTTYLKPAGSSAEALVRDFNLTHEWLAQCILYVVYAGTGFPGLILFRALLLSAFCGLVGVISFRRGAGFYASVGAALGAAGIAALSTADRPFLFTYLFLAVTMAVFEFRRGWWFLPVMFLVWCNLHGGFFMGWVVAGCYCLESLYHRLRKKPDPDERKMWVVTALCVAVTGLNPNGYRIFEVLLGYRNSSIQTQILEWQHTKFWEVSWFDAALWGGALVLLIAYRRVRPVDWMLFALFAAAGIQAVRNVTLMALVGPVVIATYVKWKAMPRLLPAVAVPVCLVGVLVYEIGWRHAFDLHPNVDGAVTSPKRAADFILKHHISGRLFNTYEQGSFLIWRLWPEQRVFTDARGLNEQAYQDANRIEFNAAAEGGPSGEELLNRYGIDVILMNCLRPATGELYLLPAALADPSQKEWKLVYRDTQAVIYMRHPPDGMPVLNSLEALDSIGDQCEVMLKHSPWVPGCAKNFGIVLARIGDNRRALEWLSTYRQYVSTPDAEVDALMARLTVRR